MKNKMGIIYAVTTVIAAVATVASTFSGMAVSRGHAKEIQQISNNGGSK